MVYQPGIIPRLPAIIYIPEEAQEFTNGIKICFKTKILFKTNKMWLVYNAIIPTLE